MTPYCDIKMPKMDGLEFLEKSEDNPDVPIIMVSGHGNIDTAVDAVKKAHTITSQAAHSLNRLLITLRNAMDKTTLVSGNKNAAQK